MLKTCVEKILLEYPTACKDNFKGHKFASYIKSSIPRSLESSLDLPNIYNIKASAGNGAWATIPWIAVFNTLITESVKSGFYCIYLFCADCSGVYLSLNQGFADKRDRHGLGVARNMLREKAKFYRDILGYERTKDFSDSLNLYLDIIPKESTTRRLGIAYEAGNILSKFYPKDAVPNNDILVNDLRKLLDFYFLLFEQSTLTGNTEEFNTDDEKDWFEDLSKYRIHRVTERNKSLSKKVKDLQGYTCKACNFNFESRYGNIGRNYIEAHHIIPISELDKTKIYLDPAEDFTVLCANCHRMIHKIKPTPTLEDFKKFLKM